MFMTKKILFWYSGDFTQYLVSTQIKNFLEDSKLYAIIDVPDKLRDFYINQSFAKLENFWFLHDNIQSTNLPNLEFLKYIEEKYQIHLWNLIVNERIFYRFYDIYKFSYNEILSIVESEIRFFEKILDEIKPDVIIIKDPGFHHLELFYQICKKRDIQILTLTTPNFGYRVMISSVAQAFENVDLKKIDGKFKNLENLIQFKKKFNINTQTLEGNADWNIQPSKIFTAFLKYLFSKNSSHKTHYTYYGRTKKKVILQMLKAYVQRFWRGQFIKKNLLYKLPNEIKFIYFPLGLELERNFLINASLYNNQIELLRVVSKSIPIDYRIIVKEHPDQISREWRKIDDYKSILTLPNVIFLHPSVSTDDILEKSSLIISVGGTTSFEASFFKKPSIIFSKTGFSLLSWIKIVSDFSQLKNEITSSLNAEVNIDELDRYITFLNENTFEFDHYLLQTKLKNHFYYGGNIHDVKIDLDKMKYFIENNLTDILLLTKEYVNKIKF